jgi:prevent-host-death family protein
MQRQRWCSPQMIRCGGTLTLGRCRAEANIRAHFLAVRMLARSCGLVKFDHMHKVATVSIYEAKTRLSHLVERALRGEQIVITRHGRPVACLVPVARRRASRRLGSLRGKIRVAADFDAPLPEDLLALFEGGGG